MKVHYICMREITYNGKKYYPGYPWLASDGGSPPHVGSNWVIRKDDDMESPQMGFVQWAPQPGRVQPASLTPEEKSILKENPYANIDESFEAASPPPAAARDPLPPCREKKQEAPILSAHLQMTEEERSDPYGKNKKGVQ